MDPYALDILPRVLPVGWEGPTCSAALGTWYRNRAQGLVVIGTAEVEADGKRWLHVSVSRRSRMPTYEDLALVKRLFIGPARKAIQVFPPEAEHVNVHPYALHLWCCLDADPLPDFRRQDGTI